MVVEQSRRNDGCSQQNVCKLHGDKLPVFYFVYQSFAWQKEIDTVHCLRAQTIARKFETIMSEMGGCDPLIYELPATRFQWFAAAFGRCGGIGTLVRGYCR